jgi:hypothetical protein
MLCKQWGDPHAKTFANVSCQLFGNGLFPIVSLPALTPSSPSFEAQAFHCPPTAPSANQGRPSTLVAIAVKYGDDVVTVIGPKVVANGKEVTPANKKAVTTAGALSITSWVNANKVGNVKTNIEAPGGLSLMATKIGASHVASKATLGYLMNFNAFAPSLPLDSGTFDNTCAVVYGGDVKSVQAQGGRSIFSAADLASLRNACGAPQDETIACSEDKLEMNQGGPPIPLKMIDHPKYANEKKACKAGCSCATLLGIEDCIADSINMDVPDAVEACGESFNCSSAQ